MGCRTILVSVVGGVAVICLLAILLPTFLCGVSRYEDSSHSDFTHPAHFDTSKADTLSVEELEQRYRGVSLPTWMPGEIELCRIYDGGSFAMVVYSDRRETDYRRDNVTITLSSAGGHTIESLVGSHPEGEVELSNGQSVFLAFCRDGEQWPVSEGFPLQNGAVAYLTLNGIWYTVSGLSGHVSLPDMRTILESMKPIDPIDKSSDRERVGIPSTPSVPGVPYVPYTPIMGDPVSREEALRLSPFPLIFPELPSGLSLADIRHYTVGSDRHYFILIYSQSPLPDNPNLWGLLYSGGMIVIQGEHGLSDQEVARLIEKAERTPGSSVQTVNGNDVITTESDLKDEAMLYRSGVIFDVVAGPDNGIGQLRAAISSITTTISWH